MSTIGLAGNGLVATFVARQLAKKHPLLVLNTGAASIVCDGAEELHNIATLATRADIVVVCIDSEESRTALLRSPDWLKASSGKEKILVDMCQGDPDETRLLAMDLSDAGIIFVDAPLHTENTATVPEASAIFFGGTSTVLESIHGILEAICPKVIPCGDVGSGHAMRLVVAAIAACNRLITYECAAMGVKNGLTIADMATVLNKSSGYNSASARVLPALVADERTADVTLSHWADDLRKASALAMRCGAPMLIATMARSTLDAATNRLGASSSVDRLADIWDVDGGLGEKRAG